MTDKVPIQDWREKTLTAGELYDITSTFGDVRLANRIRSKAVAQCRPLNASEILEAQGFRHSCGGNLIGCSCFERWQAQRDHQDALAKAKAQVTQPNTEH